MTNLYMKIESGQAVGKPSVLPTFTDYQDPVTGNTTRIRVNQDWDADQLLQMAGLSAVNGSFSIEKGFENFDEGGSFDPSTSTCIPNVVATASDQAKAYAVGKIQEQAKNLRAQFAQHADQYRVASWSDKHARALRVLAGSGSADDTAVLDAESAARGKSESATQLAQIQKDKGQALAILEGQIDGIENKAIEDIQAASTTVEVKSIFEAIIWPNA